MSMSGGRKTPHVLRPVVFALVYLVIFVGQAALTKAAFTDRFPGANDFFPRWAGGCAHLRSGVDPYAEATTDMIQQGVYGRAARPDEDQVAFAYPLHIVFFIWPTCLLGTFAWVQPLWMTALIHLTVAGTILARAVAGWRPSSMVWLVTAAWAVFVYPNARAILLGQPALLVFVLLMLTLALIRWQRPALAGAALACTTIKPQMVLLVVPWLLWWAGWTGRRRMLYGFAAAAVALLGGATLLQPNWVAGFLGQLAEYTGYTEFGSAIWIMFTYYLAGPAWLELGLTVMLLLVVGVLAWRGRQSGYGEMLWLTSLVLVATHFVAPRTATTHFAVFLLPLFLLFEMWRQRDNRRATGWTLLTLGLTLVGSWWLFAATVDGIQESALNYLPIPFLLVLALVSRRRQLAAAANLS